MSDRLPQFLTQAKREGWAEWIRTEADERAVLHGCHFDMAEGARWCSFFEKYFVHTMGRFAGKPFVLLDWQRLVLMQLFGWHLASGERRYSKGDIFVPKKMGKSTLGAAICNAFLLKGGERAEVYGVAHTREQASIIYREAAAMARKSPDLNKVLKVLDSVKRIVFERTNSFYQALAGEANARGVEGINPNLILFDEIHVQRSRELYDALAYACIARPNSLMLSVSTVGVEDRTTIWWEQYEYARGILDGTIHDDARFAFIAQADEACKDDPLLRRDPVQWRKAMPSLGVTVQESEIEKAVIEAENSPAKLNGLLRYVFNIPTAQVDRVVPMDKWNICQAETLPDLSGRVCYGGLDIASTEDLTAFVLYFPPLDGEERGYVTARFWCPEEGVRRRESRHQPLYRQWVNEGHLLVTAGGRIDHKPIVEEIQKAQSAYQVKELLFDKWNADAVVNELQYTDTQVVSVEQTFVGMSAFCQAFLNAVIEQKIWHDGNPVLAWCCANVAADVRQDAIRFDKGKSADKIDGAVAAAMAIGRGLTKAAESPQDYFFVV